jgi:predicted nuclease with TOPRIM domain
MNKTQHTPAFKVEYQQYEDGSHVCLATESGDWVADFGKEGNKESEKNAKLFADLLRERDELKTLNQNQQDDINNLQDSIKTIESLNSELLEAMKAVVYRLNDIINQKSVLSINEELALAISPLEHAISKAEGSASHE